MQWELVQDVLFNFILIYLGGAISLTKIIILASIFEFIGAVFLGGDVASTIGSGLLEMPTNITVVDYMLLMTSVLIGRYNSSF